MNIPAYFLFDLKTPRCTCKPALRVFKSMLFDELTLTSALYHETKTCSKSRPILRLPARRWLHTHNVSGSLPGSSLWALSKLSR